MAPLQNGFDIGIMSEAGEPVIFLPCALFCTKRDNSFALVGFFFRFFYVFGLIL